MKKLMMILSIALCLFLSSSVFAGGWISGWETYARGYNFTGEPRTIFVSGGTYARCEQQRLDAITTLQGSEYRYRIFSPSCKPTLVDLPFTERLDMKQLRWPWPGPVCLSCPIFRDDLIEKIYPKHVDRVRDLVDKFRIQEYNERLMELQKDFDLDTFENEMHNIELQQEFEGK